MNELVETSQQSMPVQVAGLVSQEQVLRLQEAMSHLPQAPGMHTEHFFAGGMYCRKIHIPQGTIVVSKVHKTEHLFIGCSGELEVAGQGETYTLTSGCVIHSPVGTKRIVLALTDVVCMTIHKTDKTQADESLEAEIVELDDAAKYDVNNQPKPGVLVGLLNTQFNVLGE